MKILITSDNHLGYKERDKTQQDDSFDTFEEILCIANIRAVDMILQGGDLFHENRPSRATLSRTIHLIKKYTFGNNPITFSCNKKMNYEDPNLNISIPILAIHGNHDDPSGIFSISALNILESFNLINYFGKIIHLEQVEIQPVVLDEKIAIYMLSHIRDKRLFRLFLQKKVNFIKPQSGEFFNIFVVHQNRVAYGIKDYLPHEFIPKWMDLVIYGHEHESLKLDLDNFIILQPGSTVRTSLAEKESYSKNVYIFDSKTRNIERIELKTVRLFYILRLESLTETLIISKINSLLNDFEKVLATENNSKRRSVLEHEETYDEESLINNSGINEESLINNSGINEESLNGVQPFTISNSDEESFDMKNYSIIKLDELINSNYKTPLIRIKGYLAEGETINNQKLGILYREKVANSTEILLLTKKNNSLKINNSDQKKSIFIKDDLLEIIRNNLNLKLLNEEKFIAAFDNYLNKNDKNAFSTFFRNSVTEMTQKVTQCDKFEQKKEETKLNEEICGNLSDVDNKFTFTDLL